MNEQNSKLLPFGRAWRRADPAAAAAFKEMARQLRVERESSAEMVTRLLHETPRAQWPSLAKRPELHTIGALDQLSKESDRRLDQEPHEALAIAELATVLLDELPADAYPRVTLAQLESHTWKDLGQALCYVSRYDDALAALQKAETCVLPYGALQHDQAIVWFVRATVLQHLRRFDEAQHLLTAASGVFQGHHDQGLYAKCVLATGNLLVRRGDHRAARQVLMPLLGQTDVATDATVRLTLGWCGLNLGEPARSLSSFRESAQMFRKVGRELSALRALKGVGSALLRLGHFESAIGQLRAVRNGFLVQDLIEEAGIAGLELAEAQLLNAQTEEAKALCAAIVRELSDAGLNRRALAALGYLNEAMRTSTATPEAVRSVHDYLVALRTDPTSEFVAIN